MPKSRLIASLQVKKKKVILYSPSSLGVWFNGYELFVHTLLVSSVTGCAALLVVEHRYRMGGWGRWRRCLLTNYKTQSLHTAHITRFPRRLTVFCIIHHVIIISTMFMTKYTRTAHQLLS